MDLVTVGKVVKNIVTGLDGLCDSWESREEHRQGLTEFKRRDGLSNVEGRGVQNTNNVEKTVQTLETIECIEENEATIDSGAACCLFPRDLCNGVPTRQCAKGRRGTTLKTASGQRVAHECIRTIECSTEYGFTRRLSGAVDSQGDCRVQ